MDSPEYTPSVDATDKAHFSSLKEVEAAKRGAKEFATLYQSVDRPVKKILRNNDFGQETQAMFLGIKPLIMADAPDITQIRTAPLPSRIHIAGNHLYDETQVAAKIAENPDIFDDFREGEETIQAYMDRFLTIDVAAPVDPKSVIKTGLLLGFPKDAAISYDSNVIFLEKWQQKMRRKAKWIYDNRQSLYADASEEELFDYELCLRYAHMDRNGKPHDEPGYLEDFLDAHEEQARAHLTDVKEMEDRAESVVIPEEEHLTDERIEYLLENRPIDIRGFNYGTGVPTQETLVFPQKVEELFTLSGIANVAQKRMKLRGLLKSFPTLL